MYKKSTSLLILILMIAFYPHAYSQYPLIATVHTDKPSYIQREIVTVAGDVRYNNEPVQDGLIGVQIESPLRTIILRTLPLSTNISKPPTGIEITSLFPCDDKRNFQPNVERGNYIWFIINITNNSIFERNVNVSITIFDKALIPLDISRASFPVKGGETVTYNSRMYIPNWATVGTAYVYGNVYSSLPKDGGYPLCPEKVSYFNIIESIYSEPSNETLPPPPMQNGTYEMFFRLPPDMMPGTYQVSVLAFYLGMTDSASTDFVANCVPLPPWASFVAKPPSAGPNYTITFDASSSSPEGYNDTITNYFWTFGDETNATGKIVTHAYTSIGNYTVTLNVTDSEGFWNTTSKIIAITEIHDIAIVKMESLERVYTWWRTIIKVTVKNLGTIIETFNITLYSDDSIIGTINVKNLQIFETRILTFEWNTNGITPYEKNYTLWSQADVLPNEANTTNNILIFGSIRVFVLGDYNGDRKIDIFDVVQITAVYEAKYGEPLWDPFADLTYPWGVIDIYDVVMITAVYETEY